MKIGNAGGFWGDDSEAAYRLAKAVPDLDYLTMDYLAELSMAIMAIQKEKNPLMGYAADFVDVVKSLIPLWKEGRPFKIVTNAGGLNPEGLKKVLQELVPHKKIAALSGDDVLASLQQNPDNPLYRHLESGKSLNEVADQLVSASSYLGAAGIAKALQEGADIVVTGRIADPSMVVGPALAYFGWKSTDYNKLAQATVAGHLIECGTQVTGGITTDWDALDNAAQIGFPVVIMESSGDFIVTKPVNTAGKVDLNTVKEQLLYEIGDPAHYLSPDVTVSFLSLKLIEVAKDHVRVTGALGSPPPDKYKVSAAYKAGYRSEGTLVFAGKDSKKHALLAAEVLHKKAPTQNYLDETFGEAGQTLLRVAVHDQDKAKVERFTRQLAPLVTAGPPGTTGYTGGRPKVRPVLGYWPCLIAREAGDAS